VSEKATILYVLRNEWPRKAYGIIKAREPAPGERCSATASDAMSTRDRGTGPQDCGAAPYARGGLMPVPWSGGSSKRRMSDDVARMRAS